MEKIEKAWAWMKRHQFAAGCACGATGMGGLLAKLFL